MSRLCTILKSGWMLWSGVGLLLLTVGTAALAATLYSLPVHRVTGGGQIMTGGSYTVVGSTGQPDAGQLSGGSLRVNGGVIGEVIPTQQPPILAPRAYLPIAWQSYPQWLRMDETEPNNLFDQADPITSLPALVSGTHDGASGGGDVFSLSLGANRIVEASLFTGDVNGVQLLAYDTAGSEIDRDYTESFELSFTTSYSGTYYVYVFSAPEADNSASYTLTIRAGNPQVSIVEIPTHQVDAERLNQPPQVEAVSP